MTHTIRHDAKEEEKKHTNMNSEMKQNTKGGFPASILLFTKCAYLQNPKAAISSHLCKISTHRYSLHAVCV